MLPFQTMWRSDIIWIVSICAGSIVVIVAILGVVGIIRLLVGGRSKRSGAMNREEMQMVQEIHASLAEMEKRIEALETLLLDRAKRR